jgi:phosphohistidine phosphatase
MRLYLIRHGAAGSAPVDAERELTPEGRARFEGQVRGLARLGVRFERVLSSPLVRAVQTAELLEPLLEPGRLCARGLAEALAREPAAELLELCTGASLALVGHEPWQSQLAAWLVAGERRGTIFTLEPGGVLALEGEPRPGRMTLQGYWRPEELVRIGGPARGAERRAGQR